MPEGRESPSPSRQTGGQLHDATGSGTASDKPQAAKEQRVDPGTKNLESNPKGPLEDEVKRKFDGVLR